MSHESISFRGSDGAGDRTPSYPKLFAIGDYIGISFKLDEAGRQELVFRALKSLGVSGKVMIKVRNNTALVYVDEKYFGIYDFTRSTFVD